MPDDERKAGVQGARAWALVGQLGAAIAGPIVLAVLLAAYFDVAPIFFIRSTLFAGLISAGFEADALMSMPN